MAEDAQDPPQGSKPVKSISKRRPSATKADSSADRSTTSSVSSNMRAQPDLGRPRSDHTNNPSTSAFGESSDDSIDSPQPVRPASASHHGSDDLAARDRFERGPEEDQESVAIPDCIGEDDVDALLNAMPQPPVTQESLEELELQVLTRNITLRIDLNYDHDLHFTPISGHKGEQKKRDARKYWQSLAAEFRIVHQHNRLFSCAECDADKRAFDGRLRTFQRRLPVLFWNLRDLLLILIPDKDRYQINEYLDVSLLLQEESHGSLDIVRLARWLDGLLTTHCAPMRDVSAHEMAEKIKQGAENGDFGTLVAGIEMLFQILEAMKLDVANHQIRNFRYTLIDDTVLFQQEFFGAWIHHASVEAKASREWYLGVHNLHELCQVDGQTPRSLPLAVLVHGILEGCLYHADDLKLPVTLTHDHKRLKEVRVDIQDYVHLEMCLAVFDQLVQEALTHRRPVSPPQEGLQNQLKETRFVLQNRIMDLTDGNPDEMPQIWLQYADAIALELTRAAFHLWPGSPMPIRDTTVAKTTEMLTRMFEEEHEHQRRTKSVLRQIEQSAHKHSTRFQNMTILTISQEQKHWHEQRARRFRWRLLPEIEDIARRMAHIASIHWRVWAEMVYLDPKDASTHGVDESHGFSDEDGVHGKADVTVELVPHQNQTNTPCR